MSMSCQFVSAETMKTRYELIIYWSKDDENGFPDLML